MYYYESITHEKKVVLFSLNTHSDIALMDDVIFSIFYRYI